LQAAVEQLLERLRFANKVAESQTARECPFEDPITGRVMANDFPVAIDKDQTARHFAGDVFA
jgi:hypothetical protein